MTRCCICAQVMPIHCVNGRAWNREVYRCLIRTFYAYAIQKQIYQMPNTRFR